MMDFIIADMTRVDKEKNSGNKSVKPDYARCIKISTDASLYYMIAPGLMVILVPIVGGILFGSAAVEGILAGSIVSGVQVAISASNTGGAWDNAKKETEKRRAQFYEHCKDHWPEFNTKNTKAFIKELQGSYAGKSDEER